MFTLKKNELKRFYDLVRVIEHDPEDNDWIACWVNINGKRKACGKNRQQAIKWARDGSRAVIVLEKVAPDKYVPVHINARHQYHLGATDAAAAVFCAYNHDNPTDDYLGLNKAIYYLNQSLEIDCDLEDDKAPPPLEINSWAQRVNKLDPSKLYEFSSEFSKTDLQKLTIRPGIIKQSAAGIYLYKELDEKNYSKGADKRECLERMVFNGCSLLAEQKQNGKYKIIYNDLENNYERGYIAIATLVKAVYQLPVSSAQKKKLIFTQTKAFLAAEKKKLAQKFNARDYR